MKLSFVIPCYNEEGNVELIFSEIHRVFEFLGKELEIVMINDGSKDQTMQKLQNIVKDNPNTNTTIVNFSRNFGKEAAILAGFKHTTGDYVCLIDADLQQRPEIALEMFNFLKEHNEYDSVAAFQKVRHEPELLILFKNAFYKIIDKISEVKFVSGASDFRMCNRKMIDAMLSLPEYFRFSKGIFSWVGFNTYYLPFEHEKRNSGTTKWSFWKLFEYAIEGIVDFTIKPLRLPVIFGILFMFIACVYWLVLGIEALAGALILGYKIVLGFVFLIGGLQFLMFGVMSEYLSKTYMQGKDRPVYIEREIIETKA